MARTLRIDFPGARHHVMNRGARRSPVFYDSESCLSFLSLVGETSERYGWRVHGYVLMPNHFHLLVESVHGNLSGGMSHLAGRYTQAINRRKGWEGPVFRGRFRNRVVSDPAHWRHLPVYLHLNPVRARLVMKPGQWQWSSHEAYRKKSRPPEWLVTDELRLEYEAAGGYAAYLEEYKKGRREEPDRFSDVVFGGRRASSAMLVKQEPVCPMSAKEALEQVLSVTGSDRGEIVESRPGRSGNDARSVAAYWLVQGAKLTNVAAGKLLEMSPVAVCKAMRRVRRELSRNPNGAISESILALQRK